MDTRDLSGFCTLQATLSDHADPDVVASYRGEILHGFFPSSVHELLVARGRIADPFRGDAELRAKWVGRSGWRYETTFELTPPQTQSDRLELACDGLDTAATIELNGHVIGTACNMHRRYRFDLKPAARVGENELSITFDAPQPLNEKLHREHGSLPGSNKGSNPPMFHSGLRKMACNFGWDWGPQLVTCGIWRELRVEAWDTARLGDVRPLVMAADEQQAEMHLQVAVELMPHTRKSEVAIRYALQSPSGDTVAGGALEVADGHASAGVTVDRPELWWPAGWGEQPLYTLTVTLLNEAGDPIDEKSHRVGLRSVRLRTPPDGESVHDPVPGLGKGEGMHLEINGQRVFCRGANWIPDDAFPSRITPARYRERIEQAIGANMNMLRVWGGGIYEDHAFYEACDELGVMVWQDFALACACYSEDEPFATEFDLEARDNVSRLARHPSLVMWNGGNEILLGLDAWGYDREVGDRPWGGNYLFETFPKAVAEIDPSRPYWPNSPFSGMLDDHTHRHTRVEEYGSLHIWDVWHGRGNYRNYLEHKPRFAAEFGYHGPPTWPTIEHAIPRDQRRWDSEVMKLHNKNQGDGQQQTTTRMLDDFEMPASFDDWLYLAQVMQARALTMGCEWFRALTPWCSGALFWQFNDTYPASSWSAIDGLGNPKPLWHAARRFFQPRLITIKPSRVVETGEDPMEAGLSVYLLNETPKAWSAHVSCRWMMLTGEVLDHRTVDLRIDPAGHASFSLPGSWTQRRGDAVIVCEVHGDPDARAFWWPNPDKEMSYPDPELSVDCRETGHGYELRLVAPVVVRDVCIFADRLDPEAKVSDQAFTLIPGIAKRVKIETAKQLDRDQLFTRPVLRCVNEAVGVTSTTTIGS